MTGGELPGAGIDQHQSRVGLEGGAARELRGEPGARRTSTGPAGPEEFGFLGRLAAHRGELRRRILGHSRPPYLFPRRHANRSPMSAHPTIRLKPKEGRRLRAGGPWAFSNEIEMSAAAKALAPGSVVNVAGDDGRPFGTGYFNANSLIAGAPDGPASRHRAGAATSSPSASRARELCATRCTTSHTIASCMPRAISCPG